MIYGNNQAINTGTDAAKQYEMMSLADQFALMESIVNSGNKVDNVAKNAYADCSVKK